jgi:FlaA1/EpsC-like NDP-sugar epimerase
MSAGNHELTAPLRGWPNKFVGGFANKYVGRFVLDALAWAAGLWIAALLRYDLVPGRIHHRDLLLLLPVVWLIQFFAGQQSGIYRGGWLYGSFEEVAALARTVAIAGAVCIVADLAIGRFVTSDRPVPISAALGGSIFALALTGAIRYGWRLVHDRRRRPQWEEGRSRVIVFGAGDGGEQAIRAMLRDSNSPYVPVALVDDDPGRSNLSIMGVRVEGGRDDIPSVAARFDADVLLVAVPSADGVMVRELADVVAPLSLQLRVLPSVGELLGGEVDLGDIRVPTEADLLGRHQVETNVREISQYLTGKTVVVTGAGGSIGSELCRQIAGFDPGELIMIDRDESALHAVQLALEGRALLDSPNLVLLDIRDRTRVRRLFAERRPDVVFHAAALKHLPLLESHPVEALKTNVWGTSSVLDASMASGVSTFVNISTDKAANPISVLGYSKRIAEGLTAHAAEQGAGRYLSVRFGNVLGSRGSVLTAFRAQIESGGPLTVTHPEVSRFFMTVEEAVQLVVQAGALGDPGEALVLDMGEPVRIAEVARRLSGLSSTPVPIEFTGLRPGEKMHEELFGDFEQDRVRRHPLIDAVAVPGVNPERVRHIDPDVPAECIVGVLHRIVTEMRDAVAQDDEPDAFSVPA